MKFNTKDPTSHSNQWAQRTHLLQGFLVLIVIAVVCFPSTAISQWSGNPKVNNLICNAIRDQVNPASVSDGSGGVITTWQDKRSGNFDIYAQRVNSNGEVQWAYNGVVICSVDSDQVSPVIVSDGNDGAIIAWQDKRSGNYDVYAQHVDGNGVRQWNPTSGDSICNVVFDQVNISMASDGNGGALLAWEDYRSNAGPGLADIFTQKINSAGVAQWDPNGIGVCTQAAAQFGPKVISDEAGGAFITWYDNRAGDYDIYIQRVEVGGGLIGIAGGVAVCTSGTDQTNPDICTDGAGGAIVVWQDFRSTTDIDICGERMSPSVSIAWGVDGVVMNNNVAYDQVNPKIVSDGAGGGLMTWEDFRTGVTSDIYAQRVDVTGVVATGWNVNGVAISVSAGNQSNPVLISDSNHGAIIAWADKREGVTNGNTYDIYASHITGDFALQGSPNGSPICTVDSTQINTTAVSDGNGGAIIAWQDKRVGNFDIYNSQVFINAQANSLFVRIWEDADGYVTTTSDQTLKAWGLKATVGSLNGPTVFSGGSASGSGNSQLTDATYYVTLGDSAPWVSLGYKIGGVFVNGSAGSFTTHISLAGGESDTIDFYQAPPVYSNSYRAFNPDSIALEKDNMGKVGKSVPKKADKVQFSFSVTVPSNGLNGLHLEFGVPILPSYDFGSDSASTKTEVWLSKLSKWNLTFTHSMTSGTVITVHGYGSKGLLQKVTSYWWTMAGVRVGNKITNPPMATNILKLPMPNRINALENTYLQGGFSTTQGMVLGVIQTNRDSIKKYGWAYLKTSGNALSTLSATKMGLVNLHDGTAKGFDKKLNGLNIIGKQVVFSPTVQDNILFANLLALKFSIAASITGTTPAGFGNLILADPVANVLNGLTLRQIAAKADTMMTGYPNRTFETADSYLNLSRTIRTILDAFEGVIDTNSFAGNLSLKGTHPLIDCPILKANPSAIQDVEIPIESSEIVPDNYELYQNYPNPFNPTTSIQFNLPFTSVVTMKIYNVLGQEVAMLLNHEQMSVGMQAVQFNASNYTSGVYLYRITAQSINDDGIANSFTSIKKMVLMK